MEPGLSTALAQRPQWTIDLRLQRWLGQEVRVAAESFFPIRWNGEVLPVAIPVRDLILPVVAHGKLTGSAHGKLTT